MSFAMAGTVEQCTKIEKKISTQYTIMKIVTMQLTMTSEMTAEGEKDSKVWVAAQPNTNPNKSMVTFAAAAAGINAYISPPTSQVNHLA